MSTSTTTTSSTIIDTTFRLSPPPTSTSTSTSTSLDASDSDSHSSRERERERELRRQKKKKRQRGKSKEKERDREERKEQEQDRHVDTHKISRERISSRTSSTATGETYGSYQVDDLDVDELRSEPTIFEHVPSHPQPSHTISIPTEIESPTTRIEREADETRVQIWLEENGFNSAVRHQLHGFNGSDILQLSKNDCKELIGVKEGIRLYNRLKWTKQAELEPHQQFGGIQPVKRSPYGLCDELGCQRGATAICDGAECGRALCPTHSTKYLLTSSIFCRSCYQVSSLSKVVHVVAQNEQCIIN